MEMAQNTGAPAKLTEIPLSVDEPGEAKSLDEKMLSSKTNSLKRFFKLPNKRVADALSNTQAETQLQTGNDSDVESGNAPTTKEKPQLRRFHLRLGAINKNVNNNNNSNSEDGGIASSSSKPGLKGSISNYWNSVFKRTHGVSSSKHDGRSGAGGGSDSKETTSHEEDDEEEEENETEIREEIHTLPVSEESDDASKS